MAWTPPSLRIRELIRQGAEIALSAPPELHEAVDRAVSAANPAVAQDPELFAASSRTNRSNLLYWASANVRDPGAPVPGNCGPEPLAIARDMVRRGVESDTIDAYRVGHNAAWRLWMQIAFDLTDDPDELRELLDVTAQSINAFIDDTIAGINAQMQRERDDLTRGSHADRREVIALILDGAPITRQRAEERLGYRLDQDHTAAIIWSEQPDADPRQLDHIAEALGHAARSRPLSILASTATRWVWVSGPAAPPIDELRRVLQVQPAIRMAIGPTVGGMEGFRRSHLDARTTQRMLGRLRSPQQIATFNDVELVSLLTDDTGRADDFIRHTLGELATAEPELRQTVSTFIAERHNATSAAERLYLHRNTLMRRLAHAERILPTSLQRNSVHIAVALEVLHWRGDASA